MEMCYGMSAHGVEVHCCDWCNKELNGQQLGRRYRQDFQAEGRGRGGIWTRKRDAKRQRKQHGWYMTERRFMG